MPEILVPGVHVGEDKAGPRPIARVSTSTAGFVGVTERGPTQPTLVTSWADYQRALGGFIDQPPLDTVNRNLPYAVRGFFENGGQRLYVARLAAGADLDAYVGGLDALLAIDEISLLAAPDEATQPGLTDALIDRCERAKDRFAVLNETSHGVSGGTFAGHRDSAYGAIYYPRIRVSAPHRPDGDVLVPPCGHVAGIYARTDAHRGVYKPPANEVVRGIVGLHSALEHTLTLTGAAQDVLNKRGVNVISDVHGEIRVWGARTMSSDPEWKYVNVRRLLIFIEASIDRGTQWVVFEPNGEPLWAAIRASITNFLFDLWREGALQGTTAQEAFVVRCDRTTMDQDDIDHGRLVCVVGVAPVKPAEFVVVRITKRLQP